MAPWASHWATVEGRITLRMAAIGAAEAGQLDVLDYLCGKWKVPVNKIPADEKVNSTETPLLAAVCGGKENVALHLLFLAGSEENLDLKREMVDGGGDTLLHNAAWKGQARVVSVLLHRGAPVQAVADDGHTALSVAIEHSHFRVARVILDDYRARGKLREAFEKSFYNHEQKQFIPLLHHVCNLRGKGLKSDNELLAMAHFLIKQGADVTVLDGWGQMPADADSHLHQYLRNQLEKTKSEVEGSITIRAMWWLLVACGSVLACGASFSRWISATLAAKGEAARKLASAKEEAARKRAFEESWAVDEKQSSKKGERKKPVLARPSAAKVPPAVTTPAMMRQKMRAAEETACKLALEEDQEERKKIQQGKNGKKKYERTTLREAQLSPQPREEREEAAGTAVGVKRKSSKKNKRKKPVRPPREQQKVLEPISMPAAVIEEEETEAMMLQAPVEEQQLLPTLTPLDEEVQGATTAAVEREDETSTSFSPLPDQGDEEEEEDNDDGGDKEKCGPDEAFLLEDASSMLVCPISFKLMTSAVIAMDTQSYQKEALEAWVERCKDKGLSLTSPLTNAPMEPQMMANQTVRGLVGEHIEAREHAWRELMEKRKGKVNKKIGGI